MSDVQLSGPHTDLPAPNCDGRWFVVTRHGRRIFCDVTMVHGTAYEFGAPVSVQPGDRWTLYVPADSVSSPAVPADRPQPDREDGSYTLPMWDGWWSWDAGKGIKPTYLVSVRSEVAYYAGTNRPIDTPAGGWCPVPIADPAEVERLKAELANMENANRWLSTDLDKMTAERDAARAKVVRLEADNEVFVRDRDEARAALEAERAQLAGPESSRGYEPGSAGAIAEAFEIFCVDRPRYEIEALTDRIAAASSMAIRLREADSEF